MIKDPPLPSITQLVNALQRLDADALADWAVAGDEEREHLRERVRRMQVRLNAKAIDEFAHEQEDTVAEMLALLDEWDAMLKALNQADRG
jgi:hypothetical protein